MYSVDIYSRVRRACLMDGMSAREAARYFNKDRKTIAKMLKHALPPGYQRSEAPRRPTLDAYVGIIDEILRTDKALIKKQRHTAKRIFERLRDEHGYTRRNFMVPAPRYDSFDDLNAYLEQRCLERQGDKLRGHNQTIGERLMSDLDALMGLPVAEYEACDHVSTRATSTSMVRYKSNDYSVPVAYAHHDVHVRGFVHEVIIGCGNEVIARHKRSYASADMILDPIHFLPLIEQKVGALDQAFVGQSFPRKAY